MCPANNLNIPWVLMIFQLLEKIQWSGLTGLLFCFCLVTVTVPSADAVSVTGTVSDSGHSRCHHCSWSSRHTVSARCRGISLLKCGCLTLQMDKLWKVKYKNCHAENKFSFLLNPSEWFLIIECYFLIWCNYSH